MVTKPSSRKRSANGASPPALMPPMPWAITTAGCGPSPSGRYSQASSSSPEAVGIRTVVRGGAAALSFKFVIVGPSLLLASLNLTRRDIHRHVRLEVALEAQVSTAAGAGVGIAAEARG